MNGRIFTILISLTLASCGGTTAFNEYARAGDSVALPVGMQQDFTKDNIVINITPATGPIITITAPDPAIRGVINLQPDLVSNMLVSRGIGEDTTTNAQLYADRILDSAPSKLIDWYQTAVFLDLPPSLPIGLTQIEVNNGQGATATLTLEIIEGTGTAHSFMMDIDGGLAMNSDMFDSMARAEHTIVKVKKTSGSVPTPHAIELTLSHDPDSTVGGTGKAFVVNALGYLKDLSWNDDGTTMKVIMMVSEGGNTIRLKDFRFYVAGTTTNLAPGTVKGYDINGNEISGFTLELAPSVL